MGEPNQSQPKPSDTPKVFDVMRPGKAPASPTSRPVIVGHKPSVQDSTLADKPSLLDATSHSRPLMDSQEKVTIEPPASSSPAPSGDSEPTAEPQAETPAPDQVSESVQQATSPDVSSEPAAQPQPATPKSPLPLDAIQDQPTTYAPPSNEQAQPVISHHASKRHGRILITVSVLIILAVLAASLVLVETEIR